MKALNLIICLLAVTLFVACSKKKDGNSNPYQGNYAYTPNDPRYNMYPNNGMMPGYQMGQVGSCNGPTQIYGNLSGYCGWLARDGERMCNPMVTRQLFMQYCASYATTYNYCVNYVQSGCFYTNAGCSYQGKKFKYSSTYVSTGKYSDWGDDVKSKPSGKLDPIIVTPPPSEEAPVCYEKPDDCYEVKKGKSETKKCRHPLETSTDKEKYTLLYETYLKLLQQTCGQSSARTTRPVVSESSGVVYSQPRTVEVSNPVAQNTQPRTLPAVEVQEKVTCVDLPHNPGKDCRLKRPERESAARGTTKKNLIAWDFQKGTDGKIPFAKENERGNIECKASGTTSGYIFSSYEQYVASLKKCETSTVETVVAAPATSNVVTSAPVTAAPVETAATVTSVATKKPYLAQCMNLQELHNYILNPANELSSYSAYDVTSPISSARSKEYLAAYQENVGNTLIQSRMSVYGTTGKMSAIGLDVQQSEDMLQVDSLRGPGEIIDCRNKNFMTVRYASNQGDVIVTYKWNGLRDDDLVIEETSQGQFAFRNESSRFIVTRYIGVGKRMNEKQIYNKVTADMKKAGLLSGTKNSGNRFEVLKNSNRN